MRSIVEGKLFKLRKFIIKNGYLEFSIKKTINGRVKPIYEMEIRLTNNHILI